MRGGAKYTATELDEDKQKVEITLEAQEKLADGSQIVIVTPVEGGKYDAVVVGKEGEGEAAAGEGPL
jgi:menaquinone-dependent protoporphyrinogen IX oxidase